MKKVIYSIFGLLLCSFISITNVYANSISGKLSSDEKKCYISQYVNGAGKITTYIKCYEKNVVTGYHLHKDDSTVYSGAGRKFHFNAAPGYKFVLSYKKVNGKVWIIRNNTTKLAESLISY